MNQVLIGIMIIVSGGILAEIASSKYRSIILTIFTLISAIFIVPDCLRVIDSGVTEKTTILMSYPMESINFILDRLSAGFILFTLVMTIVGIIYSHDYLKSYIKNGKLVGGHHLFMTLLLASMLMVESVQNVLAFLIVWEIMSISSFFLMTLDNSKKEVFKAGISYIIAMHVGFLFIVISFAYLSIKANSMDFSSFVSVFNDKGIKEVIFILFFIGFGTKAGFIPLHTWLPKAHPVAPAHISAIMSGIMIKTGIYGILRIIELSGKPSIMMAMVVLVISIMSAIFGIMYALFEKDIKKSLAYSSIENIGIIGIGIGIGMLGLSVDNYQMAFWGFLGSLFHILNHSIFKMALFCTAGEVYRKTHIRDMEMLGGLIKVMPLTGFVCLAGAAAISGLPPLNGFISKFVIYTSLTGGIDHGTSFIYTISVIVMVLFALIGTLSLLSFTRLFSIVFLGNSRSDVEIKDNEKSLFANFSMGFLVLAMVGLGLFPSVIIEKLKSVVENSFIPEELYKSETSLAILNVFNGISLSFIVLIGAVSMLLAIKKIFIRKRSSVLGKTWGCGYKGSIKRAQYTGSSFSENIVSILTLLIKKRVLEGNNEEKSEKDKIFPKNGRFYKSISVDVIDEYIIKNIKRVIEKFFDKFSRLQSKNSQQYVLYAMAFILMTLIWIMGVR